MNNKVKKEVEEIIKIDEFNCSVEEFKYKVNWHSLSRFKKISEDFIREFEYEVVWVYISRVQKLSEEFIYEFQDKLDIDCLIKDNKITKNRLLELTYLDPAIPKYSRFEILDIR